MMDVQTRVRIGWRGPAFWVLLAVMALFPFSLSAAEQTTDSCVACHSNPKFLVQNKLLYDYYQNWKLSVHAQEHVTCVDCHGGNPRAKSKKAAHAGAALGPESSRSSVNYQNIPKTCARCHKDIYQHYVQSRHYRMLVDTKSEQQGPNCVTCHGSMNTTVLNVNTVRQACEHCHNEKTGIYPDVPSQAEDVLSNILTVHRYYRYIAIKGKPGQMKALFKIIDPLVTRLAADWHTFDLSKVREESLELLQFLKRQREELKQASSKGKNGG